MMDRARLEMERPLSLPAEIFWQMLVNRNPRLSESIDSLEMRVIELRDSGVGGGLLQFQIEEDLRFCSGRMSQSVGDPLSESIWKEVSMSPEIKDLAERVIAGIPTDGDLEGRIVI